jgi:hypothetical protein
MTPNIKQNKAIREIINSFTSHGNHASFRYMPHKLYYDKDKNIFVFVTEFTSMQVNHLLNDFAMTIINEDGSLQPLANSIRFINDRIEYIKSLDLIKTYE